MRFITALLMMTFIWGCNESQTVKQKSKAERIAEESRQKNSLKKGRYECWNETDSGRITASPFYILSNDMYQVDEQIGTYQFNAIKKTIEFIAGPLAGVDESWTAHYISAGAKKGNDSLQQPMIELRSTAGAVLRCSCSDFMY